MSDVVQALKGVEDLIRDRSHWTTGRMAADAEGRPTYYLGEEAVAWCLHGAVAKVCAKELEHVYGPAIEELIYDADGSVIWFNDKLGHEAVLSLLRKTISRLEKGDGNGK